MWQRSGGNPFVVEELARDLRDGRDGLSDTLREIFLARVDALPQHAHAVVHAVAAGVEPVEHWLLAQVLRLPEEELIEAVRAAVAHRLLVGADDGYRLRHRLVAEVLEHELLPAERSALHRRYAEALTAAPAELHQARLAHHWRLAGEPARALPAAMAAAQEAERLHGYAEAHRHWSVALQLAAQPTGGTPLGVDRAELLGARRRGGPPLRRARPGAGPAGGAGRTGAGEPACALHIRRARYLAAAGRSALAEAEYQRALDAADCSPRERATAAAHLAELLLHLGRYADAGRRAREALELAATVDGSTTEVVLASAALGFSDAYLEDPDAGLAVMREALETAERAGRPEDVACAYLHLAELLTGPLNILEEGVVVARRGAERVAELGLGRTYETRLLAIATNGLFRVGQWAEAEKVVAAALRHRPSGADAVELLLARCRLSVGYGDIEAADRDLDAVATVLAGGGARHVHPAAHPARRPGHVAGPARRGPAGGAARSDREPLRRRDDPRRAGLARAARRGGGARQPYRAGGRDGGTPAAGRGRPGGPQEPRRGPAGALGGGRLPGPVRRRGEPPRRQRPGAVGARRSAEWDRRNHPYPAAYSRLRQAEALLARRSRVATAGKLLRQAYADGAGAGRGAVDLGDPAAWPAGPGCRWSSARRRPALAGAAPAAPVDDELAVLTAREREVLAAVAEGLTNREIGQRLFISERTIGVHVSHIFDKLQVRTRVQASAIYLRNRRG